MRGQDKVAENKTKVDGEFFAGRMRDTRMLVGMPIARSLFHYRLPADLSLVTVLLNEYQYNQLTVKVAERRFVIS